MNEEILKEKASMNINNIFLLLPSFLINNHIMKRGQEESNNNNKWAITAKNKIN